MDQDHNLSRPRPKSEIQTNSEPHSLSFEPNYTVPLPHPQQLQAAYKTPVENGLLHSGTGAGDDNDDVDESKFELTTNYLRPFLLDPSHQIPIFKYFLRFSPTVVSPVKKRKIVGDLLEELGQVGAGDLDWLLNERENTLYTKESLGPAPELECKVFQRFIGNQKITSVHLIPPSTFDSFEFTRDFMETLLKEGMSLCHFETSNQWIYHSPTECLELALPKNLVLETNPGYKIGMRQTDIGPLFWLDPFQLTKRKQKLTASGLLQNSLSIVGKIITCDLDNLFYRVDEIAKDWNPCTKLSWVSSFGSTKITTYEEFIIREYGIEIMDMGQPLILSKLGRGRSKRDYIPKTFTIVKDDEEYFVNILEFCRLSGWKEECRKDPVLAKSIAKFVDISPTTRVELLRALLNQINENPEFKKLFSTWGVGLEDKLIHVSGKLLRGPVLTFANGNQKSEFMQTGNYWEEEAFEGCYSNVKIKKWLLVYPFLNHKEAECFKAEFMASSIDFGNKIKEPVLLSINQNSEERYVELIEERVQKYMNQELQFILIILPKYQSGLKGNVYDGVKKLLLLKLGIPSQCIKFKTLMNQEEIGQIAKKVSLQVNAKLGGALWKVEMTDPDSCDSVPVETMFIGIDAYHNIPKKHHSVYAAVFSLNPHLTKFYTRVEIHTKIGQEIGENLTEMTIDAMNAYFKERGKFPEFIVIFRDGVSNAYFDLVKDSEVQQIKAALSQMDLEIKPKIFFTIIQKHTTDRMFIENQNGQFNNPLPGTVVDELITRTKYPDFYLWSQLFRGKGSGRPVRVTIIEWPDEMDMDFKSLNMIQNLTYGSTFGYYNWTGSIRVPALLQYAHTAAGLVGKHLKSPPLPKFNNTLYYL